MTTTTAPAPKRHAFRGDLEGIRGVALLVILATHLVEWPTGGQVALDVFFVLSGFLITGLLIREHAKTGTIDLLAFFRRRVRRLAPSATLVLVATLVASFLVFPMGRFITVAWDALWASLLVANWGFAIGGTDYFATDLPQSPLLHYWSLAVEEQFYLAWPFLVLAALALGARGLRRGTPARRRYLVLVLALAFAASFAWSLWQSTAEPQIAYLSTLTRVWELAVGALLACSVPLWQRIPGALRPVLAWAGMLTILVAAFIVTPETPYPGVAALIPVLSTAAVVVSGVGGENHLLITTNPVARYLGKISYTVYLWHWPVFVIMAAIFGKESLWYLVASVPLSFVLAIATFHLVEDPVRRSSWLEPDPRRRRGMGVPSLSGRRNLIIASIATVVVGVLVAGVGVGINTMRQQTAQAGSLTQGTSEVVAEVADDADQVTAMVEEGLALESWPTDVTPSVDAVTAGTIMTDFTSDPCLYVLDAETMDECIAGDTSSERTAVLLGDSTSYAWVPGLDRALSDMGFRLVVLTAGLCPFADVRIDGAAAGAASPEWSQECQDHRAWAIQQSQDLGAELVIATDSDAEPAVMAEPVELTDLRATWSEALQRSVDAVSGEGRHVVLLPPAPGAENLAECYTNLSSPSDCTVPIRAEWQQMYLASRDVADDTDGVTVVDSIDWFCADGFCPAIAGSHIVRMDSQHITAEYAAVLSGLLEQHLRDALGEPSAEGQG